MTTANRENGASEPFGTIEKYLGKGAFVIRTPFGEEIEAQVLPKPNEMDYYGFVFREEAIDEAAAVLIGRSVYARLGAV